MEVDGKDSIRSRSVGVSSQYFDFAEQSGNMSHTGELRDDNNPVKTHVERKDSRNNRSVDNSSLTSPEGTHHSYLCSEYDIPKTCNKNENDHMKNTYSKIDYDDEPQSSLERKYDHSYSDDIYQTYVEKRHNSPYSTYGDDMIYDNADYLENRDNHSNRDYDRFTDLIEKRDSRSSRNHDDVSETRYRKRHYDDVFCDSHSTRSNNLSETEKKENYDGKNKIRKGDGNLNPAINNNITSLFTKEQQSLSCSENFKSNSTAISHTAAWHMDEDSNDTGASNTDNVKTPSKGLTPVSYMRKKPKNRRKGKKSQRNKNSNENIANVKVGTQISQVRETENINENLESPTTLYPTTKIVPIEGRIIKKPRRRRKKKLNQINNSRHIVNNMVVGTQNSDTHSQGVTSPNSNTVVAHIEGANQNQGIATNLLDTYNVGQAIETKNVREIATTDNICSATPCLTPKVVPIECSIPKKSRKRKRRKLSRKNNNSDIANNVCTQYSDNPSQGITSPSPNRVVAYIEGTNQTEGSATNLLNTLNVGQPMETKNVQKIVTTDNIGNATQCLTAKAVPIKCSITKKSRKRKRKKLSKKNNSSDIANNVCTQYSDKPSQGITSPSSNTVVAHIDGANQNQVFAMKLLDTRNVSQTMATKNICKIATTDNTDKVSEIENINEVLDTKNIASSHPNTVATLIKGANQNPGIATDFLDTHNGSQTMGTEYVGQIMETNICKIEKTDNLMETRNDNFVKIEEIENINEVLDTKNIASSHPNTVATLIKGANQNPGITTDFLDTHNGSQTMGTEYVGQIMETNICKIEKTDNLMETRNDNFVKIEEIENINEVLDTKNIASSHPNTVATPIKDANQNQGIATDLLGTRNYHSQTMGTEYVGQIMETNICKIEETDNLVETRNDNFVKIEEIENINEVGDTAALVPNITLSSNITSIVKTEPISNTPSNSHINPVRHKNEKPLQLPFYKQLNQERHSSVLELSSRTARKLLDPDGVNFLKILSERTNLKMDLFEYTVTLEGPIEQKPKARAAIKSYCYPVIPKNMNHVSHALKRCTDFTLEAVRFLFRKLSKHSVRWCKVARNLFEQIQPIEIDIGKRQNMTATTQSTTPGGFGDDKRFLRGQLRRVGLEYKVLNMVVLTKLEVGEVAHAQNLKQWAESGDPPEPLQSLKESYNYVFNNWKSLGIDYEQIINRLPGDEEFTLKEEVNNLFQCGLQKCITQESESAMRQLKDMFCVVLIEDYAGESLDAFRTFCAQIG